MAKSKKQISSEPPIVVNWVNENASKLSEVRSMNPTLYSAITMALDYLNKSLGGVGDVVMPEVTAPSLSAVKGLQREDLVETFIRIFDFDNFLSVQKVLMDLGYRWREDILPFELKDNPWYRITNEDDVLDFCVKNTDIGVTRLFSDYEQSIVALVLREIEGVYTIEPFFGTDHELFNQTIVREINVLDLGLDESFLPKLKMSTTEKPVYKLLLAPFDIVARAFQIWAFDKKFEWASGNDVRVFGDTKRWVFLASFDDGSQFFLTSNSVEFYEKSEDFDFDGKTYSKKSIPDISLRMFNIKPEWESNDLFNSRFAVNKKRDLPQIKEFLLSFGFTIKVDSSIRNSAEKYVLITISDNGEISIEDYTFSAWSSPNFRKIQIGDFGLPLPIQSQVQMPEITTGKNIDPLTTNLKIKINTEAESRAFQEWAFSFGIEWFGGGKHFDHLKSKYLFIDNKVLDYSHIVNTFKKFNELEVTLKDLGIVLPLETINPLVYDIKIEVDNENEAQAFQEWAFDKGIKWNGGKNNIQHLDEKYFIIESGILMFDPDGQYMKNSPKREVTLKDLGITVPKTNVAVKKTPAPKVTTTPPLPKPDVQNLYNELDDLDI
jgi:hypothetical protein